MKTIFIVFTFILLFVSCGKKENKKSTVKLKFASSAIVNGTPMNGGIIVMGKARNHDQSFTLDGNSTDDMVVELIKDHWYFFAIGWRGNNGNVTVDKAFTGDVRCAFTQKVLEGAEDTVSFDINLAKCSQPLPSPHDFYPHSPSLLVSNNIPKLTISTCQDISILTVGAEDCNGTANEGLGKSFIVKTYFSLGPEEGNNDPIGFMDSRCFNVNVTSELQIPLGDPTKDDGVPSFMIYSYPDTNCGGNPIAFDFNGISFGPRHQDQSSELFIIGTEAWLFLEHNPTTPSDGGGGQNMFWGSGKDGNAISSTAFIGNNEERVIGINPAGDVLTVPNGTATYFQPGDEIMWYVNDCANIGCNSGFKPGRFNFVHVKSNNGNNTVTLHKPIQENHYGLLTLPTNIYLSATIPNTNFTSMQIAKVFNFENLTLDQDITAPTYSESSGKGGIRAFKVKDTMTANLNAQRFIKATGVGRDTNAVVDNSGCAQNTPCLF